MYKIKALFVFCVQEVYLPERQHRPPAGAGADGEGHPGRLLRIPVSAPVTDGAAQGVPQQVHAHRRAQRLVSCFSCFCLSHSFQVVKVYTFIHVKCNYF